MSWLGYVIGGLFGTCVALSALLWVYMEKLATAKHNERVSQRAAGHASNELAVMAAKARNERTAADAYVSRMRETAAAAAQVEARLQSDDPDKIAEAINKALDL